LAIQEKASMDLVQLTTRAFEIGDMINSSREVADYLYWKRAVDESSEVHELAKVFNRRKEQFAECERFGHYHPDYHKALDQVREAEARLNEVEAVRQFKEAENKLDELLYDVSRTIAHAVSEQIKVPSNNPLPTDGGCASGGSCNGGCG
jgi:cell fate (sporulation/competence/biofilm development) regulator YlbF (YheA/YmcA/DUF963 family)